MTQEIVTRVQKLTSRVDSLLLDLSMVTIDHPQADTLHQTYRNFSEIRRLLDQVLPIVERGDPADIAVSHSYLAQIEPLMDHATAMVAKEITNVDKT